MKYDFDKVTERKGTYSLKYDFAEQKGKPQNALPMWVADMDISAPPVVIDALKARAEHGIFGYTMPKEDYFKSVADWFSRRHGWLSDPAKFICTPGVVFAINTLIRTVTDVGDGVLICQPVYYPFATSVQYNGRRLVVNELEARGGKYFIDFEKFERAIEANGVKAFILCSPHNPVGRVWDEEELARIAEICARHGVFVISDEIHADFAFAKRHIPFPLVAKNDDYAVCTSPSKSFNLAGLQISNIYIPSPAVRKNFEDELDRIGYWEPNCMGLAAGKAAYDGGGEWLDCLKEYLAQNIAFVREYAATNLPQIKFYPPEGTYLLWLDFHALGLTDDELKEFLEKDAELWLDEGVLFGAGGSGFARLNAACPRATLSNALSRLSSAINKRFKN